MVSALLRIIVDSTRIINLLPYLLLGVLLIANVWTDIVLLAMLNAI